MFTLTFPRRLFHTLLSPTLLRFILLYHSNFYAARLTLLSHSYFFGAHPMPPSHFHASSALISYRSHSTQIFFTLLLPRSLYLGTYFHTALTLSHFLGARPAHVSSCLTSLAPSHFFLFFIPQSPPAPLASHTPSHTILTLHNSAVLLLSLSSHSRFCQLRCRGK